MRRKTGLAFTISSAFLKIKELISFREFMGWMILFQMVKQKGSQIPTDPMPGSCSKGSRMDSYDVNIFWGMGEIEELLVIPFDLPVYQIIEPLEEGMKTFIQKLFDSNKINYEIQNTE